MHSVLFHIYKFPVHSYGFMLALSFLVGIWFAGWRAKKRGLDPNVLMDVGFYVIIAAIVGARLYYVGLHFEEFSGNLSAIYNPFQKGGVGIGGLVMYGGFIGAVLAGFIFFQVKKLPFLPYADVAAPSIAFGVFLTRIGCFLNGCCYGAPTHSALGLHFPPDSPAGYYQRHLAAHGAQPPAIFASQLFESAGGLLLLAVVLLAGRKRIFDGLEFYLVGILYAVLRFAVDFSRYYGPSERLGPLSHNQVVCIGLFILFAGLTLRSAMMKKEASAAPAPPPSAPSVGSAGQD